MPCIEMNSKFRCPLAENGSLLAVFHCRIAAIGDFRMIKFESELQALSGQITCAPLHANTSILQASATQYAHLTEGLPGG